MFFVGKVIVIFDLFFMLRFKSFFRFVLFWIFLLLIFSKVLEVGILRFFMSLFIVVNWEILIFFVFLLGRCIVIFMCILRVFMVFKIGFFDCKKILVRGFFFVICFLFSRKERFSIFIFEVIVFFIDSVELWWGLI